MDLGRYLMMGRGEEASGGRERASTLADAFESVVGAIYLDGGFDAARNFVLRETLDDFERIAKNPRRSIRRELCRKFCRPSSLCSAYEVIEQTGPDHSKRFVSKVIWSEIELGEVRDSARNRRRWRRRPMRSIDSSGCVKTNARVLLQPYDVSGRPSRRGTRPRPGTHFGPCSGLG